MCLNDCRLQIKGITPSVSRAILMRVGPPSWICTKSPSLVGPCFASAPPVELLMKVYLHLLVSQE